MSDPKPVTNPVTDPVTDQVAHFTQAMKDDPALVQKLVASLCLAEAANPTGLTDLFTKLFGASTNVLNEGTPCANKEQATANAIDNPLFLNSSKNNTSLWYEIKKGWGVEKEGGKIHTFDYNVTSRSGRAKRIFDGLIMQAVTARNKAFEDAAYTALEDAVKVARKNLATLVLETPKDVDAIAEGTKNLGKLTADADNLTVAVREKLANLIVAAYADVVMKQKDDMLSFIYLSEHALLTLSIDVKSLIGNKQHIAGIALALVVNMVATGKQKSVISKANVLKHTFNNYKSSASKIEETVNVYRKNVFKGVLPKHETEAVLADVGINNDLAIQLTRIAPDLDSFRKLDDTILQGVFAEEKVSAADRESIYDIFAGILGGGNIPLGRRNLVNRGLTHEEVIKLEAKARLEGKKLEDLNELDIWEEINKDRKASHAAHLEKMDKIREAAEKTAKEKKEKAAKEKKKKEAEEKNKEKGADATAEGGVQDMVQGALTGGENPLEGLAGAMPAVDPVSLGIKAAQLIEAQAEKNAAMLAEDINATNEEREKTLKAAADLMEQMKDTTGEDLTAMQQITSKLLQSVVAPVNFRKTRMKGFGERMGALEGMSKDFGSVGMNTLKPYDTYEALVAGANGGKALRPVKIFLDKDEQIVLSSRAFLQAPKNVTITSPDLPFRSTIERTTDESEMNSFIKNVETFGLASASKRMANNSRSTQSKANAAIAQFQGSGSKAKTSNSEDKNTDASEKETAEENTALATEALISEVVFMPMKAFFLQEYFLTPTNFALQTYFKAIDAKGAKNFLNTYGSHIPIGTQTLGGMFMRTMKITTTEKQNLSQLYSAAALELKKYNAEAEVGNVSAGMQVKVFGVGAGVTHSNQREKGVSSGETDRSGDASGTGTTHGVKNASFESTITCYGPKAKTADGLYQQLMKNNATWTIIDKDENISYLPIWELMEFKYMDRYADQNAMVANTWKQMAQKNGSVDDGELYEKVMVRNGHSNIKKILDLLVLCLVPKHHLKGYGSALMVEFQSHMTQAAKVCIGNKAMPLDMNAFLNGPMISNDWNYNFVETQKFVEAAEVLADLESLDDLKYFDETHESETNVSPYDASNKFMQEREYNMHNDILIKACVEAVDEKAYGFKLFEKLYDYYEFEGSLLDQIKKSEDDFSPNCMHYIAKYGSQTLITKVLGLEGWIKGSPPTSFISPLTINSDVLLETVANDPISVGLTELFKQSRHEIKIKTADGEYRENFYLPKGSTVPVGSKIQFECNSGFDIAVYYPNPTGKLTRRQLKKGDVMVVLLSPDGVWYDAKDLEQDDLVFGRNFNWRNFELLKSVCRFAVDDQFLSTMEILESRPELASFVSKLKPPKPVASIQPVNLNPIVLKILNVHREALSEKHEYIRTAYRYETPSTRNARKACKVQLDHMDQLIKQVKDFKPDTSRLNEQDVFVYSEFLLEERVKIAEKNHREYRSYHNPANDKWAWEICTFAAEKFRAAKEEVGQKKLEYKKV